MHELSTKELTDLMIGQTVVAVTLGNVLVASGIIKREALEETALSCLKGAMSHQKAGPLAEATVRAFIAGLSSNQ